MYGTLKAALPYYRKLYKYLREYGFVINLYDPCVAKRGTYGGQLTVVGIADEMEVLHKNKEEVKFFINYMKGIYG